MSNIEFSRFIPLGQTTKTTTGSGFSIVTSTASSQSKVVTSSTSLYKASSSSSSVVSRTVEYSTAESNTLGSMTSTSSSRPSATNGYGLTATHTSSNSASLGLAIGIPLGVVAVLLVGFGTWLYLKRKSKPSLLPLNKHFYSSKSQTETSSDELRKFDNPYTPKVQEIETSYFKRFSALITPIKFNTVPKKSTKESRTENFLRRLSRDGKQESGSESNTISPLFLKRFNLNKPNTPVSIHEEPIKEKLLPKLPSLIRMEQPVEDDKFTIVKNYRRLLDDELDVKVGETVDVLKAHVDGWCLVKNSKGKIGMIPKMCVVKVRL